MKTEDLRMMELGKRAGENFDKALHAAVKRALGDGYDRMGAVGRLGFAYAPSHHFQCLMTLDGKPLLLVKHPVLTFDDQGKKGMVMAVTIPTMDVWEKGYDSLFARWDDVAALPSAAVPRERVDVQGDHFELVFVRDSVADLPEGFEGGKCFEGPICDDTRRFVFDGTAVVIGINKSHFGSSRMTVKLKVFPFIGG